MRRVEEIRLAHADDVAVHLRKTRRQFIEQHSVQFQRFGPVKQDAAGFRIADLAAEMLDKPLGQHE